MALIKCPECKKEISDKVITCPQCGYPFQNDKLDNHNVAKKNAFPFSKIVLLLIIVVMVWFVINTVRTNAYIKNLKEANTLMLSGATDAEILSNLTSQVWQNAIYKDRDSETDKFTRENGYFVYDFNTALQNLYSDSETRTTVSEITFNQEQVKNIMKELQSPPSKLKNCYMTITELHTAYIALTDLAISPSGNLTNYVTSKSLRTSEFMSAYNKLLTQIPE